MTVVTFSLPAESRDFREALRVRGGRIGGREIRVVHLGVGAAAAGEAMRRVMADSRPEAVICAGFAGGLDPRLRVGDVVIGENFTAAELLARAPVRAVRGKLFTYSAAVETPAAKAALARESGAIAVDMETAIVAEVCRAAGVPLLAVRAISDPANEALPVPFDHWFDLVRQRPRVWRLLRYLAAHRAQIGPFALFVRGLSTARRVLGEYLVALLEASPPGR